jgi:hypothetical protein
MTTEIRPAPPKSITPRDYHQQHLKTPDGYGGHFATDIPFPMDEPSPCMRSPQFLHVAQQPQTSWYPRHGWYSRRSVSGQDG